MRRIQTLTSATRGLTLLETLLAAALLAIIASTCASLLRSARRVLDSEIAPANQVEVAVGERSETAIVADDALLSLWAAAFLESPEAFGFESVQAIPGHAAVSVWPRHCAPSALPQSHRDAPTSSLGDSATTVLETVSGPTVEIVRLESPDASNESEHGPDGELGAAQDMASPWSGRLQEYVWLEFRCERRATGYRWVAIEREEGSGAVPSGAE